MRKRRTPRSMITLRLWLICFVPSYLLACLAGWDWWLIFLITTASTAYLIVPMFCIVTGGIWLLCHDDPHFRQAIRDGWRPYWDTLPTILNPSADGLDYISYWCPNCEAPVSGPFGHCDKCGYPQNGDCSAYFREYGNTPPPGVSNDEWRKWLSEYEKQRATFRAGS
jgi:hypothetical protein